jgi:hypothetical protein
MANTYGTGGYGNPRDSITQALMNIARPPPAPNYPPYQPGAATATPPPGGPAGLPPSGSPPGGGLPQPMGAPAIPSMPLPGAPTPGMAPPTPGLPPQQQALNTLQQSQLPPLSY